MAVGFLAGTEDDRSCCACCCRLVDAVVAGESPIFEVSDYHNELFTAVGLMVSGLSKEVVDSCKPKDVVFETRQ
jgi:hypothetical protein